MPNESSDLEQKAIDTALGPKKVTVDGVSVEAQDLDKILALKRHLDGEAAASNAAGGLRFAKLQPPSAG